MALRFPNLLITATFGTLSAQLSLRADAVALKIDEVAERRGTEPRSAGKTASGESRQITRPDIPAARRR